MPVERILIANRGEIAIRIARTVADLGLTSIGVYSQDDQQSLHCRFVDVAIALSGQGPAAYCDADQLIRLAIEQGADAIHPGYGFLAENADFAARTAAAGITFVGPSPQVLTQFGDKTAARAAAAKVGVPILNGTAGATTLCEAIDFFQSLNSGAAMIIKAVAGGGGRGTRVVRQSDAIEATFQRCCSEAQAAFGNGDLYVEELIESARHIEVQIVGDSLGNIVHLGERDCSVQRRHQKLIEIAPAPMLAEQLRDRLHDAALKLARSVGYTSLGTFEFLLDTDSRGHEDRFAFIECNPRLQVEHTVTEAVTGVDLVQIQLEIAGGASLVDLELATPPPARGFAIQARVNMETINDDGSVRPSGGQIRLYQPPGGPGVRVDDFGYDGYQTLMSFDSLLAKVITHSPQNDFAAATRRAARALSEFQIQGLETNLGLLAAILKHADFQSVAVTTRWLDNRSADLMKVVANVFMQNQTGGQQLNGRAGAQIDNRDPLALFAYDRQAQNDQRSPATSATTVSSGTGGAVGVPAPIQGTIVAVEVGVGDLIRSGTTLIVMEAMKMEHAVTAPFDGVISEIGVQVGDVLKEGHPLVFVQGSEVAHSDGAAGESVDLDWIRDDLQEAIDRHAYGLDQNRPQAVQKRRHRGQRTARENVADLCDDGTFVEYGSLVVAGQRQRRSLDWLRENTPADGVVMGIGQINGDQFSEVESRAVVIAYDYTVLAGTQGIKNHYKQDRMFHLAERFRLPVVIYTEGGGGRPGDTDIAGGIGMDVETFTQWSRLSGLVPMVGVSSGYCFAGNAALLGCCDVIIATKNSNIGMGGPAMIEGGGLGVFAPKEIGPMTIQVPNGVVDILVEDEAKATAVARQYLSYFQGRSSSWEAHDQRTMRVIVPENRKRMYNMRDVVTTIADVGSVLEIRKDFGVGIITALARIEGRPVGLIANNPHHLAGAIDAHAADKCSRFLQLCDAFDLPILSLMDCPGIMVGPEVEKTALVRHASRMFNTGANLSVPMFGLIVRKAYGLGAMTMCGGGSMVPLFMAAWPTAEFAPMNIEGAIKLGFRNELIAIEDPQERSRVFQQKVAAAYQEAKAVNAAEFFGIDDVIDPAESRAWVIAGLKSLPPIQPRTTKKRPYIDPW